MVISMAKKNNKNNPANISPDEAGLRTVADVNIVHDVFSKEFDHGAYAKGLALKKAESSKVSLPQQPATQVAKASNAAEKPAAPRSKVALAPSTTAPNSEITPRKKPGALRSAFGALTAVGIFVTATSFFADTAPENADISCSITDATQGSATAEISSSNGNQINVIQWLIDGQPSNMEDIAPYESDDSDIHTVISHTDIFIDEPGTHNVSAWVLGEKPSGETSPTEIDAYCGERTITIVR